MDLRNFKHVSLAFASASLVLVPMGCKKAPPITLTAAAAPPAVFAGESVNLTATAGALSAKHNVKENYTWSGDNVTGSGSTATVATGSETPGNYVVKANVNEIQHSKFLWWKWNKELGTADASANYMLKAFEPPTISCAASPSTIKPGETSTITATAVSPQNRPLTYSYTAAAGTIGGTGATAEFNSAGAPAGSVGITCNVSDDKNHTASATTSVSIQAPPPPPVPHVEALAAISFAGDKGRPERVDNQAKAALDGIALELQRNPDAKLVLVGEADAKERARTAREEKWAMKRKHHHAVKDPAAQRAVNVKDYLVTEKGIDASRITVVTGTADSQSVEPYLVPAGANFAADVQGTTPVDETQVKAEARKPGAVKHAHKKMMKM